MTQYQRGYAFERRVSAHLRDEGYYVIESRGSHGPIDLIAVKQGELLAVQAKVSRAISSADWNELYDTCKQHQIIPLLAFRDGRKLVFWRLCGRRQFRSREMPAAVWTADRVAA